MTLAISSTVATKIVHIEAPARKIGTSEPETSVDFMDAVIVCHGAVRPAHHWTQAQNTAPSIGEWKIPGAVVCSSRAQE